MFISRTDRYTLGWKLIMEIKSWLWTLCVLHRPRLCITESLLSWLRLSPGIHSNKCCSCSVLHAYSYNNTCQICVFIFTVYLWCSTNTEPLMGTCRQRTKVLARSITVKLLSRGRWTFICRRHHSCLVGLPPKHIQAKLAEMEFCFLKH